MCWKKSDGSEFDKHETNSRDRYNDWQLRLISAPDKDTVDLLAAKLDAQLKLEDFLVKFREADHAKIKVWGTIFAPVVVPAVVSLLVTAATLCVPLLLPVLLRKVR